MRGQHVAVCILQEQAARAVQYAGCPAGKPCRMFAIGNRAASSLDAEQLHARVTDECVEDAHRVAATADTCHHHVRQPSGGVKYLCARFRANHGLELPDHQRIRVRPQHGAQHVRGVGHVGHPIAHGFVDRVLERLAPGVHRRHRGAQHLHPEHVQRLSRHILCAHVDDTLQAEERARGGCRHTVLARAGLGNHTRLAHPPGQQGLSDGVVDLVRAGMRQVFALQEQAHTSAGRRVPRLIERRRPADERRQQMLELGDELRITAGLEVGRRQ